MEMMEVENEQPPHQQELSPTYLADKDRYLSTFDGLTQAEQVDLIGSLLLRLRQDQQGQVSEFLTPLLQRDFITLFPKKGLGLITENILSFLDVKSLCFAKLVCKQWNEVILGAMLWKKLIERQVRTDPVWRGLGERRGWIDHLLKPRAGTTQPENKFYYHLYSRITKDVQNLKNNWLTGDPVIQCINSTSGNPKGSYHVQYDNSKIITGQRDNSIKIWDKQTLECTHVLTGHTGSVLCLQFDEKVIVSASSDSTVRVWDVKTGALLNTLIHHYESVLHLRFKNGLIVTCSKDRTIAMWNMNSPTDIDLHRVLVGHRAAVNVVEFDEKYIVSGSGDRTIKVWDTSSCEFIRTLSGHSRGIACLDYRDELVVSGSSDNTVRLWDVENGFCLRVLEGHANLVRCIRFDRKRIVSGSYDGRILIWDLPAVLDPRMSTAFLCLRTLIQHTGRVFRIQFDDFQIVSSSQDDTILIWDFLTPE